MPKIRYIDRKLSRRSMQVVVKANEIIEEYAAKGYDLTLRQVYYQMVARGILDELQFKPDPSTGSVNNPQSYSRLQSIVNDARLMGFIDWDHIVDRTRGLESLSTWSGPDAIVKACASQFRLDLWANQPYRVEVWIEKDALAGVFERVCNRLRVPYLSCRGYTSQSEMWRAAMRLKQYKANKQTPVILHFGDHDPSGIDMSRDITDRLKLFMGGTDFHRLALNKDQVDKYAPPPNPAKMTDSRAEGYVAEFGDESWELDALEPEVLSGLVDDFVTSLLDAKKWNAAQEREQKHRKTLGLAAANWYTIEDMSTHWRDPDAVTTTEPETEEDDAEDTESDS